MLKKYREFSPDRHGILGIPGMVKGVEGRSLVDVANKARLTLLSLSLIDPHIHLGSSLSCVEILVSIYSIANRSGDRANRDYIVLSKGHAAPALYAVLAELGVIDKAGLNHINEPWSPLQGHPDVDTPETVAATGSLAQGLSAAVGLARGIRLLGGSGRVFVIVGDGELDEGQAWEALLDAAEAKLDNLYVVIDWNGIQLDGPVRGVKSSMPRILEALGFRVVEADGHDPLSLVKAIEEASRYNGPKAIIARTTRARGVNGIEGTRGQALINGGGEPGFGSMRDAVGMALVEAGERYSDLYVVTADVGESTRASWFKRKFPERYIDVGISEQHMIGVASGLAIMGLRPVAVAFSMFIMRAWEQIRNTVSRMGLNVKIIGTHSGLSDYADGSSHQSLEDIALMRSLPNMTILVPADPPEARSAVLEALEYNGPVYIRIGRDYGPRISDGEFKIGRAKVIREGSDVAIIGAGPILWDALIASNELARFKISAAVVNLGTVKPIDEDTVVKVAKEAGAVITVEDHSTRGGVGSAIAEVLSRKYPVPIRMIGVDRFGRSAKSTRQLMDYLGLTYRRIVEEALSLLRGSP